MKKEAIRSLLAKFVTEDMPRSFTLSVEGFPALLNDIESIVNTFCEKHKTELDGDANGYVDLRLSDSTFTIDGDPLVSSYVLSEKLQSAEKSLWEPTSAAVEKKNAQIWFALRLRRALLNRIRMGVDQKSQEQAKVLVDATYGKSAGATLDLVTDAEQSIAVKFESLVNRLMSQLDFSTVDKSIDRRNLTSLLRDTIASGATINLRCSDLDQYCKVMAYEVPSYTDKVRSGIAKALKQRIDLQAAGSVLREKFDAIKADVMKLIGDAIEEKSPYGLVMAFRLLAKSMVTNNQFVKLMNESDTILQVIIASGIADEIMAHLSAENQNVFLGLNYAVGDDSALVTAESTAVSEYVSMHEKMQNGFESAMVYNAALRFTMLEKKTSVTPIDEAHIKRDKQLVADKVREIQCKTFIKQANAMLDDYEGHLSRQSDWVSVRRMTELSGMRNNLNDIRLGTVEQRVTRFCKVLAKTAWKPRGIGYFMPGPVRYFFTCVTRFFMQLGRLSSNARVSRLGREATFTGYTHSTLFKQGIARHANALCVPELENGCVRVSAKR